ncbi:RNA 3'-terminal phosphate cyclase [Candidatus Woesearchaeota archaeon]|nr:RNA 3'-terminal phosphate cyclase [Candidatus Woesearchaeota archaeon]
MIGIDGSHGEGGGQILRTALAFSTITGLPFEMGSIRKGRCDSGLKSQHVYCIRALEEVSGASAEGVSIGSERVVFYPGRVKSGTFSVDVGTAGSVTLLMQSILLPLVFGNGRVRLKVQGGTDVNWSEPYDYFRHVFLPHIDKFCVKLDARLERRGYYPKGGGSIELFVSPRFKAGDYGSIDAFRGFLMSGSSKISLVSPGSLSLVRGVSHASSDLQKPEVAERQAASARSALSGLGCPVKIDVSYSESASTGSGICLWAVYENDKGEVDSLNPVVLGSDSLGERGRRAEDVGRDAAGSLLKSISSGAPVDQFLSDQLLPFIALTGGVLRVPELTKHSLSNIYVIEQFLGKVFVIDEDKKIISVGVG